jgi:hypothetical protein
MDIDRTLDTDAQMIAAVTKEAGALAASFFGEKYEQWEKSPGNPVTSGGRRFYQAPLVQPAPGLWLAVRRNSR